MLRRYCENSACAGPITCDDYDASFCPVCQTLFCDTPCRDAHMEQLHPEIVAAGADPVSDAEYDAFWSQRLPKQRDEFMHRFGFDRPRRVA